MRTGPVLATAWVGFLVVGVQVHPAVGQDALGQGNALDNDLAQTNFSGDILGVAGYDSSGYGNVLDASLGISSDGSRDLRNYRGFSPDFQVGNLLVTGSIAGGKNFRGQVGYTAPGDFQGVVGADEIYAALRGSGLSQIQYVNSALSNDRYANAMGMGLYEYRRDYTPAPQIYNVTQASEINQDRIRLDRTNAYTSSRDLYDTAVNSSSLRLVKNSSDSDDEHTYFSLEASPVQGLYVRQIDMGVSYSGLSLFDRAALSAEIRRGGVDLDELGFAYRTPTARVAPEAMLNAAIESPKSTGGRLDNKIEGNILLQNSNDSLDAYERVVRDILLSQTDGDEIDIDVDPKVLARVRMELDEIRALTMGQDLHVSYLDEQAPGSIKDMIVPSTTQGEEPEEQEKPTGSTQQYETEEEERERLKQERIIRLEKAAELLRNGGRIESFSEGQTGRIAQLMAAGEELLREGSYFDAESRFDQVLRINPGNPLALYGRANAQLAAGLYLSSALSLRKLYTSYPELIGTTLAPEFLPSETRLRFTKRKLNQRIQRRKDLPSYGLCLAYTGRMLEEPITISEGLSYMVSDPSDAVLADLLGRVWLER